MTSVQRSRILAAMYGDKVDPGTGLPVQLQLIGGKLVLHALHEGTPVPLACDADGVLETSASVTPPEGGATEARQITGNTSLGSIDGKLPALSGGRVPVVVDALPVGSNTIGAVTGPSAAALATQATLDALNTKIPATQALGGTLSTPTAPILGALLCGYSAALTRPIAIPVDSAGIPSVTARKYPPTSRSASVSLQTGRTIATFSVTPYSIRVFTTLPGYIVVLNKASAAADNDVPYGARVWEVEAGNTIDIDVESRLSFSTGLVVAHFTQIYSGASLATIAGTTACLLVECLYD